MDWRVISQVFIGRMGLLSWLACTCIPMDLPHILSYYFCCKPKCVQGSEKSVVKFDETGSDSGGISVWSVADIDHSAICENSQGQSNPFFIDRKHHQ